MVAQTLTRPQLNVWIVPNTIHIEELDVFLSIAAQRNPTNDGPVIGYLYDDDCNTTETMYFENFEALKAYDGTIIAAGGIWWWQIEVYAFIGS